MTKKISKENVWIEFKVETVNNTKLALFFTETYSGLRKKVLRAKSSHGKVQKSTRSFGQLYFILKLW